MSLYYFFLIPVLGFLFVSFIKAKPLINKKPKLNYISLLPGNEGNEVFIKLPTLQLFFRNFHATGRPMPKPEPFNNVDADKIKNYFSVIGDKKSSIIPEFKKDLDKPIKETGLISSIFILIISYIIYLCFDLSTNQFQFVREYYNLGFYDICLGIDGSSIYFVVRPLTDNLLLSKPFLIEELSECRPSTPSIIFGFFSYLTFKIRIKFTCFLISIKRVFAR